MSARQVVGKGQSSDAFYQSIGAFLLVESAALKDNCSEKFILFVPHTQVRHCVLINLSYSWLLNFNYFLIIFSPSLGRCQEGGAHEILKNILKTHSEISSQRYEIDNDRISEQYMQNNLCIFPLNLSFKCVPLSIVKTFTSLASGL